MSLFPRVVFRFVPGDKPTAWQVFQVVSIGLLVGMILSAASERYLGL